MEQTQTNEILKTEETIAENKPMTVLDYILLSRYFLPILTTVGWVIGFTISQIKFFEILAYILIAVGIISALTVSPIKFLKFIFTSIAKCFTVIRGFIPVYGVADICAGIFGFGIGLAFGLIVVFGVPAVFTISKFFSER